VVTQIGHSITPPQQIGMQQLSEGRSAPQSSTFLAPPSLPAASALADLRSAETPGRVPPSQTPTSSTPIPQPHPKRRGPQLAPTMQLGSSSGAPTPGDSFPAASASLPAVPWLSGWCQQAGHAVATATPLPASDVTPAYVHQPPRGREAPMWLTSENREEPLPHLSGSFPQLHSGAHAASNGVGRDGAATSGILLAGSVDVGLLPKDSMLQKLTISLSPNGHTPTIRLAQQQSLTLSHAHTASLPPTGTSLYSFVHGATFLKLKRTACEGPCQTSLKTGYALFDIGVVLSLHLRCFVKQHWALGPPSPQDTADFPISIIQGTECISHLAQSEWKCFQLLLSTPLEDLLQLIIFDTST